MTATHNIMSLDVGSRRIGIALASNHARIAEPLLTIDRLEYPDIFTKLIGLFEKHAVGTVVIGLPRGMEGQETAQTASAREFAAALKESCDLNIYMVDEAATSLEAEDELKARRKPYQKSDIDKLAAAIILRDWLAGTTAGVVI